MQSQLSRRGVFGLLPAAFALPAFADAQGTPTSTQASGALWPEFPAQNPKLVFEMIGAAHGNLDKVKELVAISPNLAKATYDWGYGDWESAIGAAAHVGSHDIIKVLLDNGARPDIFTFATMGNVAALKAMIEANPGIQKTFGPHGITLLTHARIGGEPAKAALEYLTSLGDAGNAATNLPITDAEKEKYLGTYKFGAAPNDQFVVSLNRNKALVMTREGTIGRSLQRVEEHAFAVAAAPHLRIRFKVEGEKAVSLTIHEPTPIVTALRA
ncbi:MAG TPA: hypothetical protein VK171_06555 [Fimbriimonas sp.]|nr:hypothetical protein [Fimbriimonas sp.]